MNTFITVLCGVIWTVIVVLRDQLKTIAFDMIVRNVVFQRTKVYSLVS